MNEVIEKKIEKAILVGINCGGLKDFENSDKDILKFCEEENDNYNKMLAENNAVNSKNNVENAVADSSSEPSDDKNTENNNIQTSANQLSDNSSALQSRL